jgi:hypothetical protein
MPPLTTEIIDHMDGGIDKIPLFQLYLSDPLRLEREYFEPVTRPVRSGERLFPQPPARSQNQYGPPLLPMQQIYRQETLRFKANTRGVVVNMGRHNGKRVIGVSFEPRKDNEPDKYIPFIQTEGGDFILHVEDKGSLQYGRYGYRLTYESKQTPRLLIDLASGPNVGRKVDTKARGRTDEGLMPYLK